jgi:hypothetical protein
MRRLTNALKVAVLGVLLLALTVVLYAQASYPSSVASFPTRVDGPTSIIHDTWFNGLQNEVVAIETALLNGFAHVLKPQASATYDLGTTGLQWRNAYLSGTIYQGATNPYTGWTVVTSTNTGTQNDFAPGLVGNTELRMNNATLATITGFAGGYDGQLLRVPSVGTGQVDFSEQDTNSAAANRMALYATTVQSKTSLAAGVGEALFQYDGTAARWRLLSHEQGAWITPTFNAANFAGSGGMTWTVAGGNVTASRYWLKGRTLLWSLVLDGTSVSGGQVELRATIPGGFTLNGPDGYGPALISDNGATRLWSTYECASAAFVRFYVAPSLAGNWSAAASTTRVYATITCEVQ